MSQPASPTAPRPATPYYNPNTPSTKPQSQIVPENRISSTGEIDPSLLQQDNLRKAETKPLFTDIILQAVRGPGHKQVEVALREILGEKDSKKYAQYLQNALHDYTLIETSLQNSKLPLSSLPVIYRGDAIHRDLSFLQFKGTISDILLTHKHSDFYHGLKDKPHVLLGFYSFLVLGLFAAGKARAETISNSWGAGATNLYQFAEDREKLKERFKQELNTYMATVPESKMQELQAELTHIWEYVGDLLNVDIREKKA